MNRSVPKSVVPRNAPSRTRKVEASVSKGNPKKEVDDELDGLRAQVAACRKKCDAYEELKEMVRNKPKSVAPMKPLSFLDHDLHSRVADEERPDEEQSSSEMQLTLQLSSAETCRLANSIKEVLVQIWCGKRKCDRHELYKKGGVGRRLLKSNFSCGPFTDEQVLAVSGVVSETFSKNNIDYFDYIFYVLLPEALTIILSQVQDVTYEEAEKMMQR